MSDPTFKTVECEGKWFGRHNNLILWFDDESDLVDALAELRDGRMVPLNCLEYQLFREEATGYEAMIPHQGLTTWAQRNVVIALFEEHLRERAS